MSNKPMPNTPTPSIRDRIKELLKLISQEENLSVGVVLAEDDEEGDTSYSFFLKGYPQDIVVGAGGLLAVAQGEQAKFEDLMESSIGLEDLMDEYDDEDDDEDDDDDIQPPRSRKGIN
jgi:hypothetical protein